MEVIKVSGDNGFLEGEREISQGIVHASLLHCQGYGTIIVDNHLSHSKNKNTHNNRIT